MGSDRILVIGAGVGGLVAALELAAAGRDVLVLERAATPGGKMRQVVAGGVALDAGPTVLTMRWVFEEIFAAAGASFADAVTLRPAALLARHAWSDTERLDLFADIAQSADAIGRLAGAAEARGYRQFCDRARRTFELLDAPFIRAARPSPVSLAAAGGVGMLGIAPFAGLWSMLGEYFHDPRLRQLFGRYATYCGSNPFLAPATLALIAHVEREGVWLVEGGMHQVALALAALAERRGAVLRYQAPVAGILVERGRAAGVQLEDGECIAAAAVVVNADAGAVGAGVLGSAAARAVPALPPRQRSLSAVTWAMLAETEGFDLARHTVFFSRDYAAEFDALARGALPPDPTVYLCAQDRDPAVPTGPERLLCLVNAPPTADHQPARPEEIAECTQLMTAQLTRCGLTLRPEATVVTTPTEWEAMFPRTGGALYGQALDGWRAPFRRMGATTRLPGLLMAGGGVHPGPGVPMAALSGRMAAAAAMQHRGSTAPSRRVATPGGMSTR